MNDLHVYCPDMIDWWPGWFSPHDMLNQDESTQCEFTVALLKARDAALEAGMEPELREVHVSALPHADGDSNGRHHWLFAFKQDNNGTVYIVSPFALPWMERVAVIQ